MSNIKHGCYKCKIEVDKVEHFTSEDDRLLVCASSKSKY